MTAAQILDDLYPGAADAASYLTEIFNQGQSKGARVGAELEVVLGEFIKGPLVFEEDKLTEADIA